ncbi:hypothetical protein ICY20_06995 [Pseudomonas sp. P115]|uniref:hypothetical protein n=1 Tax=Pseudomonas pisciculturae TaxID=2730413 RepID=UPI00135C2F76|nr:hypothetical protein [Pseudomonas pisciculturae]MBF6027474.1 hypothetical protein [Pseudomonas pisciculturae]
MRYLKVTAHDLVGIGRANLVRLQFYQGSPSETDKLVDEAVAYDFTADGRVDYSRGDVTHDGKENLLDKRVLDRFANTYLKLNWYNRGPALTRYMKIFSEDFYKDGTPDTVRLHLHKEAGGGKSNTQVAWHAAYDFDNDGTLEWNIHFDINHDGLINDVDQQLVQQLAELYLQFNWHEPETFEVKVVDIPAS